MNDVFERIIVRCILPRVIQFCIKDKAWFMKECKRAISILVKFTFLKSQVIITDLFLTSLPLV